MGRPGEIVVPEIDRFQPGSAIQDVVAALRREAVRQSVAGQTVGGSRARDCLDPR